MSLLDYILVGIMIVISFLAVYGIIIIVNLPKNDEEREMLSHYLSEIKTIDMLDMSKYEKENKEK